MTRKKNWIFFYVVEWRRLFKKGTKLGLYERFRKSYQREKGDRQTYRHGSKLE